MADDIICGGKMTTRNSNERRHNQPSAVAPTSVCGEAAEADVTAALLSGVCSSWSPLIAWYDVSGHGGGDSRPYRGSGKQQTMARRSWQQAWRL